MKHVPEGWLRKLALAYALLCGVVVVAYPLYLMVPASRIVTEHLSPMPVPAILAAANIIYAAVFLRLLHRKHPWASYFVLYIMMNILAIVTVEITGGYNTPFWYIWVAIAFLGGMLGVYATAFTFAAQVAGVGLIVSGTLVTLNSPVETIIAIAISWPTMWLGVLLWSRFYEVDSSVKEAAEGLAQGEIHKEKVKTDFILGSMTSGVVMLDPQGNIQYMNPAAATLSGWDLHDAMGLPHQTVLKFFDRSGNEYPVEKNPLRMAVQTQKPVRDNNIVFRTKSGKQLMLTVDAAPLIDNEGHQTGGIICIFRDVSQEKMEEQQRAEFISTASHEMRTPVAAIEGYLALAMNDKVCLIDEKARGYLDKAHASTKHLGQLFQDLLTSAKADDGRLASHPQVIEFAEYLEKLIEDLRFAAEKKGLALEFVMGTDQDKISAESNSQKMIKPLYYTEIDPDRMREVITNLFDNAVKYTPSGRITIGLTGNNDVVQFYIKDTGGGIPPEDVPHLFQKFYRVDNTATRTIGGTGLGLFICRKIVELYNGRIWVKSDYGKGSTFFVNLPRLTTEEAEEARIRLARTTHPQQHTAAQLASAAKPTQPASPKPQTTMVQ